MKIRELYIENYKMFQDFKIDFVDSDDKPLDIVVLAGVNGSGKTTLLECLSNFNFNMDGIEITFEHNSNTQILSKNNIDKILRSITVSEVMKADENIEEYGEALVKHRGNMPLWDNIDKRHKDTKEKSLSKYIENIKYIPIYQNNIIDLKETIRQKYIDRAFEIDKPSKALEELQSFIADIFKGLDLTFNLSSIDYNKNLVRFQDNSGNEFDIDALSTGEKTLLSKLLYLYFKDYNDKVILIDEPELSLHPSWQNRVLKIYENFAKLNNCQIIIATHSPHIIGSASNESLRILRKNSEGKIEAIKDLKAHGRDINSILFDVMGEVDYRPKEFRDKIDRLHIAIDDKKFEEATKQLNELKKDYGENDAVVLEAQMLIDVLNPKE